MRIRNNLIFLLLAVVLVLPLFTHAQLTPEERAALEAQLTQIEQEINQQRQLVQEKQQEGASLQRDIDILDAQISKTKLEIRALDISIAQLNGGIREKSNKIGQLSSKIDREKESLAEVLRRANELQSASLVEVVLGNNHLSDFFSDVNNFDSLQQSLKDSTDQLHQTKTDTEGEKADLEARKREQLELRGIQDMARRSLEVRQREKNDLLKITRGKEQEYQRIIARRQQDAAAIRARLFNLQGASAIPFGRAVELANLANAKTGIRPAFLLGIIAEESNLGQNVGKGNWLTDMNPRRDQPIFKDLTARLGLDPDQMPVSRKAWYGYGGAMGPAQFIPSTWVLYEERISSLTGHNPPNPWDAQDAFMGAALYLTDSGAKYGNYSSERRAALCYLAGCKNAGKRSYAFYGDDVMSLASKFEADIKALALK